MITDYNKYLNKLKIVEALKTFPLYLSDRLREVLSNIDHEISTELLSMHSDLDSRVTKTFIDVHDEKSDYITFIQPNKVVSVLGLDLSDDDQLNTLSKNIFNNINDNSEIYNKFRSEFKLGRLITELFGTKYPNSIYGGQNKKDIESFVNLYKALYNQDEKFGLLELVSGDDISYWYKSSHYYNGSGSLGGSCMQSVPSSYFDIYTKNPEKVRMLVLFSDDSKTKIKGRAIVWKLDVPEGRTLMDRAYTNDYSDEQLFINYAKEHNWIYKSSQSMGSEVNLVDPELSTSPRIKAMLTLNDREYANFPYCDTMTYFNRNTKQLSNSTDYNYHYELTSTDGAWYSDEDDYEEVWSNYHNEDIRRSNAKWCEYGQDWVRNDDAIRVYNTGSGTTYAVPGNDQIVVQHFTYGDKTMNKYFLKERCVWSDYLNTNLFEDSVVIVWLDKEKTKTGLDHKKRKDLNYFEIDGENYTSELVDPETKQLL